MGYVKLLCNTIELQILFPTAKLLQVDSVNQTTSNLKINSDGEIIDIIHHIDVNIYNKLQNCKSILDLDTLYVNPVSDLTIICDRKLWYELYVPLIRSEENLFSILEKRYVEKNVTVLFNFAILEAVNYETEKNEFLYDFKFNTIKLTDYELFKNKKNFYYDSFYSLFHILCEGQLNSIVNKNLKFGSNQYPIYFGDFFENFDLTNTIYRYKLYNHTCLKPRYHRIKFLLEADKKNILDKGRNNINVKFLNEYLGNVHSGNCKTDNSKKFSENHKKYFNIQLFENLNRILNKINITDDAPNFLYNHLENYFLKKEYNEAYIEVVGETHCIFDLEYGFFTEKSLKPILSNNFLMVYGSNKVYSEFKRIGVELFLNEFGINGIENENEIEQINIITNALKKLTFDGISNFYIKNHSILKNNRKILIEYYCNIINSINKLLIKNKNKLL